jgi:hypothetical protein
MFLVSAGAIARGPRPTLPGAGDEFAGAGPKPPTEEET